MTGLTTRISGMGYLGIVFVVTTTHMKLGLVKIYDQYDVYQSRVYLFIHDVLFRATTKLSFHSFQIAGLPLVLGIASSRGQSIRSVGSHRSMLNSNTPSYCLHLFC